MNRIIRVTEKYGEYYLDASTDELWLQNSFDLLKKRLEDRWYLDPEEIRSEWEADRRKAELELLKIPDEQIEATPEVVRADLKRKVSQARLAHTSRQYDIDQYRAIVSEVENGPTWSTHGRGDRARKVPTAWLLLEGRSDHEYEDIGFIEVAETLR